MSGRRPVVVVTGGGGGIGAAIAESVARTGAFVVTLDPLMSVDGLQRMPEPEQTTAGRITAAGGAARTSTVSVTDRDGVARLFAGLADEFGALDAVVNVAGISRPTGYATGTAADWHDVLSVHLDGYRNVLAAALPLMAAAGRGHVLGVTSGSGWRSADAGAYGCAKRAVAALTWQLGRQAPPGIVINAISPIAATRMVTAALARASKAAGAATGGLALSAMPEPRDLGPLGAHLVDAGFDACRGRVLFAGGSEVAVVDEPRLLEVVRTQGVPALDELLRAAVTIALDPAETQQRSGGGSNSRFGPAFDAAATDHQPAGAVRTCAVIADRPDAAAAFGAALRARGVSCIDLPDTAGLAAAGTVDAVLLADAGRPGDAAGGTGWQRILAEHDGLAADIECVAARVRTVAGRAADLGRPVRLVTVTDATTAGGRSRAQAVAQLARAARKATGDLVRHVPVSSESTDVPAEVTAHLLSNPAAAELSGAELVCGAGWLGLRSHPRPTTAVSFGGPEIPAWFDDVLVEAVRG